MLRLENAAQPQLAAGPEAGSGNPLLVGKKEPSAHTKADFWHQERSLVTFPGKSDPDCLDKANASFVLNILEFIILSSIQINLERAPSRAGLLEDEIFVIFVIFFVTLQATHTIPLLCSDP